MLQANDFKITSVRLVAYTPNHADFKQSAALAAVLGKFGKRFDGAVQAIPLPREMPPEFPRIQLVSTDGRWGFSASLSSITSSWNRKDPDETTTFESVVRMSKEPIEHHVRENDVQVGRLAIVVTRAVEVGNPSQSLIDWFCCDRVKNPDSPDAPLRNSQSFEIHNHKRYELRPDLTINSWVRCRSGIIVDGKVPVVTVEQDINTLAEETEEKKFDVEMIGNFYDMSVRDSNNIIKKYFPVGD